MVQRDNQVLKVNSIILFLFLKSTITSNLPSNFIFFLPKRDVSYTIYTEWQFDWSVTIWISPYQMPQPYHTTWLINSSVSWHSSFLSPGQPSPLFSTWGTWLFQRAQTSPSLPWPASPKWASSPLCSLCHLGPVLRGYISSCLCNTFLFKCPPPLPRLNVS